MKRRVKELQKIKGVGEVLTKRLIKAGYTSFEAIVAAGEEGLKNIKGVNPQMIRSILKQATALAAESSKAHERKVGDIKAAAAAIRKQVEGIAQAIKERPVEELQGRIGSKIETQLSKMLTALKKVEGSLGKRVKKEEKTLAKAGKHLAQLSADTAVKGIGSRLKKARKSLKKIYA
jgi:predicted flap endonuclease-1-like 5' DNA nuclease